MLPSSKGTASPTGPMGNSVNKGSHMPAGGGPFAGALGRIAMQTGRAAALPSAAPPTGAMAGAPAPAMPSGRTMPGGSNLSQLAQLFLSGPQKPANAATPGATGTITNPVYPTLAPPPTTQAAPAATAAAAPAAYQSQKGEVPLEGGGYFYNGQYYYPVGDPHGGIQSYSSGAGHDQKYLTLKV